MPLYFFIYILHNFNFILSSSTFAKFKDRNRLHFSIFRFHTANVVIFIFTTAKYRAGLTEKQENVCLGKGQERIVIGEKRVGAADKRISRKEGEKEKRRE